MMTNFLRKTVIIADDHPFVTEGMEAVISEIPELALVGTAGNGIEAIALIKKKQPDCALLDLSMPGANGLEVFLEAKRWSPETRFAIVTGISAAALFKQLYDAGIDGLLVKNTPPEIMCENILRIANGGRVICETAQTAIKNAQKNDDLSDREIEVLQSLAMGQNNKQIAELLGVSPKTIDSHRTNLLRKMRVNSTAALLVKAMRMGLLKI